MHDTLRRPVAAVTLATAAFLATSATPALAGDRSTADFRVLPYQLAPALDGILLTWFTTSDAPGTVSITGPGLDEPLVLPSMPMLDPVLDYQAEAELTAGGEFPFADTAIFEAPGVPARNWRHRVRVTGLEADALYTYTVTQGDSSYSNTFRTAPTADTDRSMRFIAISDSETLVRGRTRFRDWSRTTPQVPGSTGRPEGSGIGRSLYVLPETEGYRANIEQIKSRNPDLMIMPGDLVEGTGNEQQRRWDEFWRHNAGEYDDLLSGRPLVAAWGNNCAFNGGAGGFNPNVQYARNQWSAYFDWPGNGSPEFKDLYYRTDYGPVTIITLCSVGAMGENDDVAPPVGQGISSKFPLNLDTNRAWLTAYPFGDIPDFNTGTPQWDWAVRELAAAREAGQIILVQWHHTPFSRGVHGSSVTSNQSGEAMRIYAPLLEQYRAAVLLTGHSEVSEQSWFDLDGDGYGIHLWDVGAAGDGLRGAEDAPSDIDANIVAWRANPLNEEGEAWVPNPWSVWTADQSEAEHWDGNRLIGGGKHYGFLEMDLEPLENDRFRLSIQYWQNFPITAGDEAFTVTGYELRPYANTVVLEGPADDLRPVDLAPTCAQADLDQDNTVGMNDLMLLLDSWGDCGAGCSFGDLNGDGQTGFDDLIALLVRYGGTCGG